MIRKRSRALDEDVHPPVVEDVRDLFHLRERADVAATGVVLEHEAEGLSVGDALADQLLVARLEDVQRHALRRGEHEREREQADLRHARSVVGRESSRSGDRVSPCGDEPVPTCDSRSRALRAGQARRGAAAGARPRARRQARVERRRVGAVARRPRGDRAVGAGAEPLSRRRRLPVACGASPSVTACASRRWRPAPARTA